MGRKTESEVDAAPAPGTANYLYSYKCSNRVTDGGENDSLI